MQQGKILAQGKTLALVFLFKTVIGHTKIAYKTGFLAINDKLRHAVRRPIRIF